ncbi:hypothetical protein, partial [Pseudomonas cerasi]
RLPEYAAKMKPVIPDYEWITYGERVIGSLITHWRHCKLSTSFVQEGHKGYSQGERRKKRQGRTRGAGGGLFEVKKAKGQRLMALPWHYQALGS